MDYCDTNFDLKFERAVEQEWEEATKPEYDGETMRFAARALRFAIEDLDNSCDCVNEAAEVLVDTPEGYRIASILSDMEDLLAGLKIKQKEYEKRSN